MTEAGLALDDALRALAREPLTAGALAQRFCTSELAVHVVMLGAEANRLVYRTGLGEWAITDRGRQVLDDR